MLFSFLNLNYQDKIDANKRTFLIQLIMKISEMKRRHFEAILTPLSSKNDRVVVSNLNTKT